MTDGSNSYTQILPVDAAPVNQHKHKMPSVIPAWACVQQVTHRGIIFIPMCKVNLTQASWGFYSRLSRVKADSAVMWAAATRRFREKAVWSTFEHITAWLHSSFGFLHLYLHPVREVIRYEDNTQMTRCNLRNCMCLCSPCPYLTSGFSQYFDQIRGEGQQNIWWYIVRAQFEWVAPTDSNLFNSRGSKPSFSLVFQTTLINIQRCAHHSPVYFRRSSVPLSPWL